jgi:hypothetical protein
MILKKRNQSLNGRQDNYEYASANGIKLVAPVPGKEGVVKYEQIKGDIVEES